MRRFVVLSCRPFSTQNASLGDRPENGIFLQNQSFAQRKAMWQLRANCRRSPTFEHSPIADGQLIRLGDGRTGLAMAPPEIRRSDYCEENDQP